MLPTKIASSLWFSILVFSISIAVAVGKTCPEVRCDFNGGLCDWTSTKTDTYQKTWAIDCWYLGINCGEKYVQLDVKKQSKNVKGRLTSPWLDSLPDRSCHLQFSYFLEENNGCRLSLHQAIEEPNRTERVLNLWNTTSKGDLSTGTTASIECRLGKRYQIFFIGERLDGTRNACGESAKIRLGAISCNVTTTAATHSELPETTGPASKNKLYSISSPTDITGTPAARLTNKNKVALQGIIIGSVVFVVIATVTIIVVVIIWRRQRRHNDLPLQSPNTNSAFERTSDSFSGFSSDNNNIERDNSPATSAHPTQPGYGATDSHGYDLALVPATPTEGSVLWRTADTTKDSYDHICFAKPMELLNRDLFQYTGGCHGRNGLSASGLEDPQASKAEVAVKAEPDDNEYEITDDINLPDQHQPSGEYCDARSFPVSIEAGTDNGKSEYEDVSDGKQLRTGQGTSPSAASENVYNNDVDGDV